MDYIRLSWANTDRFDIVANAHPNTSDADARLMLRALLVDRFKLTIHEEQRVMPVFALVVGKSGAHLIPPAGSGGLTCHPGKGDGVEGQSHIECANVSLQDLADLLPDLSRDFDRPVLTRPASEASMISGWIGRRNRLRRSPARTVPILRQASHFRKPRKPIWTETRTTQAGDARHHRGPCGACSHRELTAFGGQRRIVTDWYIAPKPRQRGGGLLCQLAERASCKLHSWHATVEPQNLKCRPMRPGRLTHDPAARNAGYVRQRER